jgi:hypothetical protein
MSKLVMLLVRPALAVALPWLGGSAGGMASEVLAVRNDRGSGQVTENHTIANQR